MPSGQVVVEFTREDFGAARQLVISEAHSEMAPPGARNKMMHGSPRNMQWRRPNMGVRLGESGYISWGEQPSSISVLTNDGKPLNLMRQCLGRNDAYEKSVNALAKATAKRDAKPEPAHIDTTMSAVFTDFILTSAHISAAEKSQIVETFGESYFYFFGKHAQVLRCEAVLINTADYPWFYEWVYNFDNVLRGSQLMSMKARAYLSIGLDVYEGYFANYEILRTAADEYKVPLSFTFYVTNVTHVAETMFGSWYDRMVKPETYTQADKEKEDAGTALGKKMLRTLTAQAWGLLTDPSRLMRMGQADTWAGFGIQTGSALAGDMLSAVANSSPDWAAVLGFTASAAGSLLGTPTAENAIGLGTGFASDMMNGLVTAPDSNGFDSNGNAMVTTLGVNGQASGAAKSGYLPSAGSW